ncbi:MAG TPA: Nudix family hydrolase [Methylophilaceae bacterium]|nr:Nudix family hydrolase [Methylophilaceae bacterium]
MNIKAAVGILIDSDNRVLLAQRPEAKTWSSWWEFPGGKLEENESPRDALTRELKEEIGIDVIVSERWVTRTYSYDEHNVTLYFFKVTLWSGKPASMENQNLRWVSPLEVDKSTILPPNVFILNALSFPDCYAITNIEETSKKLFYKQLLAQLNQGLKLIQIREKNLLPIDLLEACKEILEICKPFSAKLILNSNIKLAYDLKVDGIHLTSLELKNLIDKPKNLIIGASCHSIEDIRNAEEKGVDFAVLSPVQKTISHPKNKPMGWAAFSKIINNSNIPVYALGGMKKINIKDAHSFGSVGIASQREIWKG